MLSFNKKHANTTAAMLFLAFLLASCGGGDSGGSPAEPLPTSASTSIVNQNWILASPIPGTCCNHAQIIIDGLDANAKTQIYTNAGPGEPGSSMQLYEGTLRGVVYKGPTLSINTPSDRYIRTFGLAKRNGTYYALLYTGDGYPTTEGYSPSWATSEDGVGWTWSGHVSPYPRSLSSGQALTAEPDGSFKAWIDQVGGTLREMSSPDGLTWKDEGDIWPTSLPGGEALFPSATRTNKGTMITAANTFPATKIRTLWKCHGQKTWSVLEDDAPIRNGKKGTVLAWDSVRIHAYANGTHWIRAEPDCATN